MAISLKIGNKFSLDIGKVNKSYAYNTNSKPSFFSLNSSLEDLINVKHDRLDTPAAINKALQECPQLVAILRQKALAYAKGRKAIVKKSGKEITDSDEQNKLITRPNFIQSGFQYEVQKYFYTMAYGYCPVMVVKSTGFSEIYSRWILPPDLVEVTWSDALPFYKKGTDALIQSVKLNVGNGKKITLPKEDIYFYQDTTGHYKEGYFPESRLTSLSLPIGNLIQNYKSRKRMISKPLGMWVADGNTANDVTKMGNNPMEIEKVQKWLSNHGTLDGQFDSIVANVALKWEMLMYPLKDLQLLEMQDYDTHVLADGLGFPDDLLGNVNGSKYNNQSTSEKRLYTDFIIPEAANLDSQDTECLRLFEQNRSMLTDYSYLDCLQENKKDKSIVDNTNARSATLLFDKQLITYGEAQERIGVKDFKKEWANLFKYEIPELNIQQNGNENNKGTGSANSTQGNDTQSQ